LSKRHGWRARASLIGLAIVAAAGGVWVLTQPQRDDRIVFAGEQNGAWDLWWVRGDGSGLERLTSTPLDERAPALSADRARIAYSTSDGSLWMLDTASRQATRLPLDDTRRSNPSWSPDGRQFVYTTYTMSAQGEDAVLWLYDLEARTPRQLLSQDGAQDFARFHPDGQTFVYSSSGAITVFGFGYVVIQQLWTMSLMTGRVQELLLARGKDTEPAWSRDGRALVFASDREGGTQLWRADADGSNLKRLTAGATASTHPAWSPDGRDIVFVSSDGVRSSLAIVDADGSGMRPLAISAEGLGNVRDPHWQ
jgi:TolB protein